MRHLVLVSLLAGLAAPVPAAQLQLARVVQPAPNPTSHEQRMAALSPSLRDWVAARARAVVDSDAAPEPARLADEVRMRLAGQDYASQDIEALVQLVMAEASRQADADMREIMAQMKAENDRKARMREAMQARQSSNAVDKSALAQAHALAPPACEPPCVQSVRPVQPQIMLAQPQIRPPAFVSADAIKAAADEKDSLSEMGETDSLQLQMAMDRKAKLEQAISNMMKKSSDTASTITSNLK